MCRKPCKECPYKKTSIPGYMGGNSVELYSSFLRNNEEYVPCHMTQDTPNEDYCVGRVLVRLNDCKQSRNPDLRIVEEVNKENPHRDQVFDWAFEFDKHHSQTLAGLVK